MSKKIDWDEKALESEIAYSVARGGIALYYPIPTGNFFHIHNSRVPWAGDFNRAVGAEISDFASFDSLVKNVEGIHERAKLEKPNRYDIKPPVLQEYKWKDFLESRGYKLSHAIFLKAKSIEGKLPKNFKLIVPSEEEYLKWYKEQQQKTDYYNDDFYKIIESSQKKFIEEFKPHWMYNKGKMIGWVYCANLGNVSRLFEVEILESERGKGYGKLLLNGIRNESFEQGSKFVLLQSPEDKIGFYEKCGFKECSRNSVIKKI